MDSPSDVREVNGGSIPWRLAQLLLRWAHLIVGISWIGASLYFMWLDSHLTRRW